MPKDFLLEWQMQHPIFKPWHNCPNAVYCILATEAWKLPLSREDLGHTQYWQVLLFNHPEQYNYTNYKKYMKKYGWVEAVELQYHRWSNYLEVQRNIPKYGFAQAIPLELNVCGRLIPDYPNRYSRVYRKKPDYSQAADGLWWYGDRHSLKQVLK